MCQRYPSCPSYALRVVQSTEGNPWRATAGSLRHAPCSGFQWKPPCSLLAHSLADWLVGTGRLDLVIPTAHPPTLTPLHSSSSSWSGLVSLFLPLLLLSSRFPLPHFFSILPFQQKQATPSRHSFVPVPPSTFLPLSTTFLIVLSVCGNQWFLRLLSIFDCSLREL